MRMNIAPRWEEVSYRSQMEVYRNYLNDFFKKNGCGSGEPMSFEEFYENNRRKIFKYIRQTYQGA